MTIPDLIQMAQARVAYLSQQRTTAVALGDVEAVARLDTELAETEATLATLRALG
jgi:hypothetical protein